MTQHQEPQAHLVRPAAELFVRNALRRDDSLFTPGQPIWSLENLDDLHRRFVENPDESGDTFLEKFKRQLAGAPAPTVQLAAEVLYVYCLIPQRIRIEKKRENVETVLSWSAETVTLPVELLKALGGGIVTSGGTGYGAYQPFLLTYLIELAQKLKRLPADERDAVLDDPWKLRELAHSFSVKGSPPMREALLHLVHPDAFEQIVSAAAKQKIADTFADRVPQSGLNVDQKLLEIRRSLADEHGPDVGFYDAPIRDRWQPEASRWGQLVMWAKRFTEEPTYDADERDYKLQIAASLSQARRAFTARDAGWFDLLKKAFGPPNNLTNFRVHGRFLDWIREDEEKATAALRAIWDSRSAVEERIREFSKRLPASVLSGRGTRLSLASVLNMVHDPESEPPYRVTPFRKTFQLVGEPVPDRELDEAATYLHALDFLDRFSEKAAELGLMLRDRLDAQSALWCVTSWEYKHWPQKDRLALKKYLDYRSQDITLQYSKKPFSLPPNLWIIGTMNTADRSIALVDAALRRRFHFVSFDPQTPPIGDLLRRWLAKNRPSMSWIADVVERANALLDDRDLAIGPSYFLDKNLDDEWAGLVWKHSILPYVAEQLFDEPDRLAEFQLEKLRREAAIPDSEP